MRVKVKISKDKIAEWRKARKRRLNRYRKQTYKALPPRLEEPVYKAPNAKVDEWDVIASICRESFYEFVKTFWHAVVPEKPRWNWHIRYICNKVQKYCERIFKGQKKKQDLVINISPGTTKSTILSVMLPAWVWTRMPTFRFIGASYSYPLAMDLSRKCRDIIRSSKYKRCFPDVKLREDQDTKGYFATTRGGYRYAVGVNGSVTGMHAHLIVIDDPLDPNMAASAADLAAARHWIKETLPSRKVDKRVTPIILVMQRLHQDDPTALFLEKKKVEHVCLPAEDAVNVKPQKLRLKYVDGLMDPVRLDKDVLKEAEEDMGQFGYSAQYRQDPVPAGGGMFKVKKLHFSDKVPTHFVKLVRYWDKAGTSGKGAYTVGVKMGLDSDGRFWVLDVVREQLDSYARERLIEQVAKRDGRHVLVGVEQEPGSGGKESAEGTARRLGQYGFRVRLDKPGRTEGNKIDRADPYSTQVNAGNVWVLKAYWNQAYVEELKFFPVSKYKDQVDASSGAFAMCHKKRIRVGGMKKKAYGAKSYMYYSEYQAA